MRIFFGLFLLCTVFLYPSEQIQFISCNVTFKRNLENFVCTLGETFDTAHCINEYGMTFAQALRALIELNGRSPQLVRLAHQHNVSLDAQKLSLPCIPDIGPARRPLTPLTTLRPESPRPRAIALQPQSAPTTFPVACTACKEVTIAVSLQQPLVVKEEHKSVAERLGFNRIFSCCKKTLPS